MEKVDDSAVRNMWPFFAMGVFDNENNNSKANNVTSVEHNLLARELASASTVLLKNDGVLPLSKVKNIVVVGDEAINPTAHGGGSGAVSPYYTATPLDGIRAHFGIDPTKPPKNNCSDGAFEDNIDYFNQKQQSSAHAGSVDECCALCATRSDCNAYTLYQGTCWMKGDASGRTSKSGAQSGVCKKDTVPPGSSCKDGVCVKFVSSSESDIASAVADADVAIVFVGTSSHEGADRRDLTLGNQDSMIEMVASVLGKKTVVVAVTPGALLTPWRETVGAILVPFMPGQEYGNAITDVLVGNVNPAARLPITFPKEENDMNMSHDMYPGNNGISLYSEALQVGYRWYNAHNVIPAFSFGHGLSYTEFEYSDLKVKGRSVSFSIKNAGKVDGAEVPQMYLGFPVSSQEPPKQLKGFTKLTLKPDETKSVTFDLVDRDMSIWDISATEHQWSVVSGDFQVMVGPSSDNIRLTGTLTEAVVV